MAAATLHWSVHSNSWRIRPRRHRSLPRRRFNAGSGTSARVNSGAATGACANAGSSARGRCVLLVVVIVVAITSVVSGAGNQ